ncbi:DUF1929 domain-containing protein [Porticoccus sp. W117]|uniref:galactose oxidase-like domain-containing protein n=1 Tax=Porticoccus sp. W117 TaxID=3054777 RepID=UPI0025928C12|nr:galactose oxidase-like domain-containing protein [Porticoccus sp. W117]MDM3870098.1 DUF1929 domain-containing protein [Porticoccus sp. W117]
MAIKGIKRSALAAAIGLSSVTGVFANDTQGAWGDVFDWNLIPIHSVLTPDGRVMTFGTHNTGVQGGELHYSIWDPALGTGANAFTLLPNTTPTDIFCAAQIILPSSGEIMLAGGDNGGPGNSGNNGTTLFDSDNDNISNPGHAMAYPRWYPTTIALPNGEVLVQGGSNNGVPGTGMLTPEIYSPATGWRSLMGATSAYAYGDDFKRWWYPRSWVLSDGRVFGVAGPAMYFLDYANNGSVTSAGTFPYGNIGATSTAVMYSPDKILQLGGGHFENGGGPNASGVASIIDVSGDSPSVTNTDSPQYARHWGNVTLLPDGDVLLTGGSLQNAGIAFGFYNAAEIWDPDTENWTTLAAEQNARLYHSTAILLPDATVLSGGGGAPGPVDNLNAQIFYPPYLYNGDQLAPRPSYTIAETELDYSDDVAIQVTSSLAIDRVTLVKTGAVTHSFNNDQRIVEVPFTASGNTLTLSMPDSASAATPGFYMLFVIDSEGTPSVADIIHLKPGGGLENLVDDSGFESIAAPAGSWTEYDSGATFGPWSIDSAVSVQSNTHHGLGAGGASGSNHVDLNGDTPGEVSQTIDELEIGEKYNLSVKYALHSFAGGTASASIAIADVDETITATNVGSSNWLTATYQFTATGTSEDLTLAGVSGSDCCGVLVDDVTIYKAPPEPLVKDGGFETTSAPAGAWTEYASGSTFGPWTVNSAVSVQSNTHHGLGNGGASGQNHVDLNGTTPGSISQTITGLQVNQAYNVSVKYALHSFAGGSASASIAIADVDETITATNVGSGNWLTATYQFTATATSEDLTLAGVSGSDCCGVLVDDVAIEQAPTAPLVQDGGFETIPAPAGGWHDYAAGSAFGPWQIDTGSVSVQSNTHHNLGAGGASGSNHLDVNGPPLGKVSQVIDNLVAGQDYSLTFKYALHSFAGGAATVDVTISDLDESLSVSNVGTGPWLTATYQFTASGTSETLSFEGTSGNPCCGVLLDDVSIQAE